MEKLKRSLAMVALGALMCVPVQAGTVTYIFTDPQGTPLVETDANGNVVASFDYGPYGAPALGSAPNGPGYTGHVHDADTSLTYMQTRYYDSAMDAFISGDSGSFEPGDVFKFGLYAYANDNAMRYIDPTGMDANDPSQDAPKVLPPVNVTAYRPPDLNLVAPAIDYSHPRDISQKKIQQGSYTFADCVAERRWDWGRGGASGPEGTSTTGNLGSGAQAANVAGNIAAGSTGSGISTATHATTWQHRVGSIAGQAAQRAATGRRYGLIQARWSMAGRFLGRVAIVTTVWEGGWDIGSFIYCGGSN